MHSIFDMKVTLRHHTTESVFLSFDVDCSTKQIPIPPQKTNKLKQTKKNNKQNTFYKINQLFVMQHK